MQGLGGDVSLLLTDRVVALLSNYACVLFRVIVSCTCNVINSCGGGGWEEVIVVGERKGQPGFLTIE